MKKYAFPFLALFLLLSVCSCTTSKDFPSTGDFFFWMDGYLAAPRNSEWNLALTYYTPPGKTSLFADNISELSFVGIDKESVHISNFEIQDSSSGEIFGYDSQIFYLTLSFSEAGIYKTNKMHVENLDGTEVDYKLGSWVFDVDQDSPSQSVINQEGSPYASSNSNFFPIQCRTLGSDPVIASIQVGLDETDSFAADSEELHKIPLYSDAPVVYIRPKIEVFSHNLQFIEYGNGCYCGALEIDDSDLQSTLAYIEADG